MGVASTIVFGTVVVVLFLGGFGTWAALAPLESAAIAQGIVSVNTKRKTVQHLEGGIVADILVEEGAPVTAGQTLLTMDDTQARTCSRSPSRSITQWWHSARASWPKGTHYRASPGRSGCARRPMGKTSSLPSSELFEAGAQLFDNHAAIYEQQIAQMREEIVGLEEEIKAKNLQLDLLEEEVQEFE